MKNSMKDIEKIIKNYEKETKKIDEKYDKKKIIKELDEVQKTIEYQKGLIEKVESESTFNPENEEFVNNLKEKLKQNEEKAKKLEEKRDKSATLKKEMVLTPGGREITNEENDKILKNDLKTAALRQLNEKKREISEEINEKAIELEEKRKAWNDFEYEYEEDSNGKKVSTNDNEVKELKKDFENVTKELAELNEMQVKCDEYINQVNQVVQPKKEEQEEKLEEKEEQEDDKEKEDKDTIDDLSERIAKAIEEKKKAKHVEQNISSEITDFSTMRYSYTDKEEAAKKGAFQYDIKSYKSHRKQLRDEGVYNQETGEVIKLDKKALKKVDPFLIDFLANRDNKIAINMIKTLNEGKDLSEFRNIISYDMENANAFGFRAKLIYRKIALNAMKNGLYVENADATKTWFDKLTRRSEKAFQVKEQPKALEAPKEKKKEQPKTKEYNFKDLDFKDSLHVDVKDEWKTQHNNEWEIQQENDEKDLHEVDNGERDD